MTPRIRVAQASRVLATVSHRRELSRSRQRYEIADGPGKVREGGMLSPAPAAAGALPGGCRDGAE